MKNKPKDVEDKFWAYNVSFGQYHDTPFSLAEGSEFIKDRNMRKGGHWILHTFDKRDFDINKDQYWAYNLTTKKYHDEPFSITEVSQFIREKNNEQKDQWCVHTDEQYRNIESEDDFFVLCEKYKSEVGLGPNGNLVLYAPDSGGYDISGEMQMEISGNKFRPKFVIKFCEYVDGNWKVVKSFNLKLER